VTVHSKGAALHGNEHCRHHNAGATFDEG